MHVLPLIETDLPGLRLLLYFAERTMLTVAITSFSPVRSAHWCGGSTGRTHRPGRGSRRGGLIPQLAGAPRRGQRRDARGGARRAGGRAMPAGREGASDRDGGAVPAPQVLGLRGAAVLGALARLLGPRRSARPG